MPNQVSASFFKDADGVSRRAELEAFFGPRAGKFLKTYDTRVEAAQRLPGQKAKFRWFKGDTIWPAFFVGPVWFFYRKMWAWGVGVTVLMIVLGMIPLTARLSLPLAAALAGSGSMLYLGHAVKTIERMRAASPSGILDRTTLAAAGGVSKRAGWIAGVLYAGLTAFGIYGIALEILAGRTPR